MSSSVCQIIRLGYSLQNLITTLKTHQLATRSPVHEVMGGEVTLKVFTMLEIGFSQSHRVGLFFVAEDL